MNENVVVKTKNSKGLIAIVIILLIAVIGLVSFIVYDKVIVKDDNKKEEVANVEEEDEVIVEKKIDKYLTFNSEIKNVYIGTSRYPVDDQTSKFEEQTLYLYENGQYYLSVSSVMDSGEIGYYEEKDNIIILHSIFTHDSQMNINYGESTGIITPIYKESDDRIISTQIGTNNPFILEKNSVDTTKISQIKETFAKYNEDECKKNYYCGQKQ